MPASLRLSQVLVRIGLKKYCPGGDDSLSPSEAVERILMDMLAHTLPETLQNSNDFRLKRCYNAAVDTVLRKHQQHSASRALVRLPSPEKARPSSATDRPGGAQGACSHGIEGEPRRAEGLFFTLLTN